MKEFPGGSAAARSEQAPSRPRPSRVARRLIFGPRSLWPRLAGLCCFGLNDERIEVLKVLLELGAEPLVFGLHCDQLLPLLLLRERAARGKQRERQGQHVERWTKASSKLSAKKRGEQALCSPAVDQVSKMRIA